MFEVLVYSVVSDREIGKFKFPRIPVRGDFLEMPTHSEYEVVKVTLWSTGDCPIVLVRVPDHVLRETVAREEVKNTYFKQGEDLISGKPLPVNSEGDVVEITFVGCRFHPNCEGVPFIDCKFENCEGDEYLDKFLSPGSPNNA